MSATVAYCDLRTHIANLRQKDLLWVIDRAMNKDTEIHPLVRWQFRGGLAEDKRRAFLFTNIVDALGRRFQNGLLVGGLAASPQVYATGLQCEVGEIAKRWQAAQNRPIDPVLVTSGPVQEVVLGPADFAGDLGGLCGLPIPISTPGFDNAPYLTSAHAVTKDPETGVRNVGNYRCQIKSSTRCGLFFATQFQHGYLHWLKARAAKKDLAMALVIGAPPVVSYAAVQKTPLGVDEYGLAGGLAQEPVRLVKCQTIDLEVPADAELVLEGYVAADRMEPEGPFGESHGYVHQRSMSPVFHLTGITHRRDYLCTSFISQVTPSESSVIKKLAFEPALLNFLRRTLQIQGVRQVAMHEPLTNLRKLVAVQFESGAAQLEIWRALKAVSAYHPAVGKIVIAVDPDIDPHNADALWWAVAYRCKPHEDVQILRGHHKGHSPPFHDGHGDSADANMLINATLKADFPPVSLPAREFMERARAIWEELNLPPLSPQPPWHGYVLSPGEWPEELAAEARLAVAGRYLETGRKLSEQSEETHNNGDQSG